jgi:hypothetical protein
MNYDNEYALQAKVHNFRDIYYTHELWTTLQHHCSSRHKNENRTQMNKFLFMVFHDTVSGSGHRGPNGRRISVLRNNVEGSGSGLIWDTIPAFLQINSGSPRRTSASTADVPAGIRTRHLWKACLHRCSLSKLHVKVFLLFNEGNFCNEAVCLHCKSSTQFAKLVKRKVVPVLN